MSEPDGRTTPVADIDLRSLAEKAGAERAFLTLYASSPGALGQLDTRLRRLRDLLEDDGSEACRHLEQNERLLRRWLGDHAPHDFAGLVVFACWALDWVEGHALDLEVPDVLRVGASPYLRPLAELQDEYETFAIVAADNSATRIFVVTATRVEEAERVSGGVKNRVKKGGWSQKRYARRRDNELHHYASDVVERLEELTGEHELERIVLLGSGETVREIHEAMPPRLADRVVAEEPAELENSRDELIDEALELVRDAERASERDLWEQIREDGLSNDLAVTGATDVLRAVAVGRVESILVTRDAAIAGTRCRECENVVHGATETCQICGSASVFEVDLVDELVRLAETTSASVDFADPIPGLSKAGDVAALLRY